MSTGVFKKSEFGAAIGLAVIVEIGIGALLAVAGASSALSAHEDPPPPVIPIQITPVVEDLPMLKLGSKRNENQLPDMWRKPKPKPRYEDKSAPSAQADKNPATLPTNELAKSNEKPPPPDAELAKKVDENLPEEVDPTPDPNMPEEGAADGVVGGEETDPLKAFIMDQYKAKLIAWFKQGFDPPDGKEFCGLTVLISAHAGADRTVTNFSLSPSGNTAFDERVRKHLQSKVGQQLPPPPPKYPEFAERTLSPRFSGENSACKDSPVKNKPSNEAPNEGAKDPGEAPAPEAPAPEAPMPEAPMPEAPAPEAPAPGLDSPGE